MGRQPRTELNHALSQDDDEKVVLDRYDPERVREELLKDFKTRVKVRRQKDREPKTRPGCRNIEQVV